MSFETMLWAIAVIIHGVCVQACPVPKDVIINRRVTAPGSAMIKFGCDPPKCEIVSVETSGGSGNVILTILDPTGGDLMQDDPNPLCRAAGSTSATCEKTSGGNYITKGTSFWVVLTPPENKSFENVKVTVTLDGSDPKILLFGTDIIINRRITGTRVMIEIECEPPNCEIASAYTSGGSGTLTFFILEAVNKPPVTTLCRAKGNPGTSATCKKSDGGNYITNGKTFWLALKAYGKDSFEKVTATVTLAGSFPKIISVAEIKNTTVIATAGPGAHEFN